MASCPKRYKDLRVTNRSDGFVFGEVVIEACGRFFDKRSWMLMPNGKIKIVQSQEMKPIGGRIPQALRDAIRKAARSRQGS